MSAESLTNNEVNHLFVQFLVHQSPFALVDGFAPEYKTYFHLWMYMASRRYRYSDNSSPITRPSLVLLRGFGDGVSEHMLSDLGARIQRSWLLALGKMPRESPRAYRESENGQH